jgi:hypothetical protein
MFLDLLSLVACRGSTEESAEVPSWNADVAPIVQKDCSECHQPGGAAFDLTDPAAAAAMAPAMAAAVESRRMPPWGAFDTPDCAPERGYVDDRRLSDEEIATIVAWSEAGAPTDADAVLEAERATGLGEEAIELQPAGSYASSGRQDEFACLVVDPGNATDLWVDAVEVVPTNDAIAHHTLIFVDTTRASDALVNADGWYDCSGGTGLDNPGFLGTWVPGAGPTYAPESTGMRVPAGAAIVLQMHYHPGGEAGLSDRTSLRLRTLDEVPPRELYNTLIGNAWSAATGLLDGPNDRRQAEFRVPADVSDHTETMRITFDGSFPNIPIASVGAHMHLIGTGMEVWLERGAPDAGEPTSECLLPASRYDYDWQQLYRFDGGLADAPMISGGDSLVMRCTYDNTLDNPGTRRALDDGGYDAPIDVYLGEGTLDEMCIGLFSYVY